MAAIKMPVREFVRNYKIPVVATVLLILLVIFMVVFHQYNLSKVGTVIAGNPLISADGEKLISQDQSTSTAIDTSGDDVTVSPNTPAISNGTASSGASGSGSSAQTGGNGTQPVGGSNTPSAPVTPVFNVHIVAITDDVKENCPLLSAVTGCSKNRTFTGTIAASNGPGIVQYRWERSDGTIGATEQKSASAGTSVITVSHTWTDVRANTWIRLRILAPNQTEKQYTFGA